MKVYDPSTVKAWAGNSAWRACRADYARFRISGYSAWGSEGFWALLLYRSLKAAKKRQPAWLWFPLRIILAITRKLFTLITHMDIDPSADIGPGLLIPHVGPLRIHGQTTMGADCVIHHVCSIGAGPHPGGATIGDHVFIGCHSSIIGCVSIGDGAIIAANSLVIADVPPGATAIGVPAKVLPGMPNSMSPRRTGS